jgi:hypothetical protein
VEFIEIDEVLKRLIDEEYTRHPFTAAARWWCTCFVAATGSTASGYSA